MYLFVLVSYHIGYTFAIRFISRSLKIQKCNEGHLQKKSSREGSVSTGNKTFLLNICVYEVI